LFWLSLNFMLYRLGFWFVGLPLKHCPCLGNLTDVFHLKPERVETVLSAIVLALFAGSMIGLLCSTATASLAGRTHEGGRATPALDRGLK